MPQPQHIQQSTRETTSTMGLALSLIIPAYNEVQRLPPYLETIRPYLEREYANSCEVLVIDDGSTDQSTKVLANISTDWPILRTIRHSRNLGKGAAVRTGVLGARGDRLLYADADGAAPIDQEQRLREAIDAGADIAVGSRLVSDPEVERNRSWRRAVIGQSFASVARRMLHIEVRDTQCGFKMLRATTAKRLFELSRENGYLFDLEILALAQHFGYRVMEVPINWSDQPGSRLQMHREFGRIIAALWRIRRRLNEVREEM